MKLLAKYNRVNIITTVSVMLVTGLVYYQVISSILINKVDKSLLVEENEIFDYAKLNHKLPQEFESKDQQISFYKAQPGSVKRRFIDTNYIKNDENEQEYESGRGLISSVNINGIYYKITIVESKVEADDLIKIIFIITSTVILLLLFTLFIINRLILNRLWQPFYQILQQLKSFSVADNKYVSKHTSSIDEFNELNREVAAMALRVKTDYKNLKSFTENAAHELLTPIAIVNSKLDMLIQTDKFTENQTRILDDLYIGISRLNKLNRALLLLVKLENNLDKQQQPLSVKDIITETLSQFEEIFVDKHITVTRELDDKKIVSNANLLNILLNNLLSNAVRHNYLGGSIDVTLTQEKIEVSNTGDDNELDDEKIFTRFHKSAASEGTGLGLTICRQVCENLGFTLKYNFKAAKHMFTIHF